MVSMLLTSVINVVFKVFSLTCAIFYAFYGSVANFQSSNVLGNGFEGFIFEVVLCEDIK